MTWIAEEPFWLIFLLLLFAVCAVILAFNVSGRAARLSGVLGAVLFVAAVGVFVASRVIETDREAVRKLVLELAHRVEANDVEGALAYMHPDSAVWGKVQSEMPDYEFDACRVASFKKMEFDANASPPKCKVEFVVGVYVDAPTYGYSGPATRAVILYLEKHDGEWKVVDYYHFDPRQRDYLRSRGEEL